MSKAKMSKVKLYYTRDKGKQTLYSLWTTEPAWSEQFKQWLGKDKNFNSPTISVFAPPEGFPKIKKGQKIVFE